MIGSIDQCASNPIGTQPNTHAAYLGFLTGLGAAAIRLVVQFLRNNTQELRLIFTTVVIGGADAYELEMDKLSQVFNHSKQIRNSKLHKSQRKVLT